jgi:hypothetical protein
LNNEDARDFSAVDFQSIFESIWLHSVPSSHALVFHYLSYDRAKVARKSGVAAETRFNGVPLSLRHPHVVSSNDFTAFNSVNVSLSDQKFPNEEVLVLSLPREFLEPLPGFEDDPGLCMISAAVLSAMRPSSFSAVMDAKPWMDGVVMLPPHCILRSFVLMYADNSNLQLTFVTNVPSSDEVSMLKVFALADFLKSMKLLRQKAFKQNLIPLYHYTSSSVLPLIMKNGLRIGSQMKGEGGVYFSTQGPASYGIGSDRYELNIIKDCFGVDRVYEFENQGKLDVVIVYGCDSTLIDEVPIHYSFYPPPSMMTHSVFMCC